MRESAQGRANLEGGSLPQGWGADLVIEDVKFEGKKIKKIVQGKEITIVIASLMPENARYKLKETLERIINEGSGGLIAIIL